MAQRPDDSLISYREFSGLRNTVPVEQLALEDLDAAENCDINDAKHIQRRTGYGAAVVSGSVHSLWSSGSFALAVRNNTLVRIHSDYSLTTLRTGLSSGLEMSYAVIGDRVYYSNGAETGVVQDGVSRSWGLQPPVAQPDATEMGGVLPAGRYQYAVTFLRSDGQESGTPAAGLVTLSSPGGIRLGPMPVSTDPDVTAKAVYFTKRDGETLFRVGVVAAASTTFDYQLESSMQVPLATQHLRQPPAGQIVREFNGRILVAAGNTLRYSEPYAPELFDLRKGYAQLDEITLLEPLDRGLYLGTSGHVFWLEGDLPEKWAIRPRLVYGAIRRAAAQCSRDMVLDGGGSDRVVVFGTTQGICIGAEDGQITNLTQDRFLYPAQEQGGMLIRRHRGMVQAVMTLRGTETAAPAA